ncbi:TonB-dependent receptor domain-containing protein [Calothrix sp. UHCC 0171]|uniref:TonB-dependent receptor domain-containing protein n=1 Tax=Calothrix sp. UHCC 0171 TaxID=3110245 RepID=UPI002B1FAFE2|nr:TonB-dependent receptor [Calothrix sp. UHCC 0171]MEA5573507.1 TonB-dependent receptor [Calothrix sp. UHCC 0171]
MWFSSGVGEDALKFNDFVYISVRIGVVSTVYLLASPSVLAEISQASFEKTVNDTSLNFVGKETNVNNSHHASFPLTSHQQTSLENVSQLSDIQLPSTIAKDLLVQSEQTPENNLANTQITAVRLKETPDGVEVILETPNGTLQVTDTINDGNTYIADINNAVLALPEGKEFRVDKPAEGIAAITVTQIESNNKVRVMVTGTSSLPNAQVRNTANGLTLSLSSPEKADIELTVTAQKRPEDAQDVPFSLTVIPRQQIEDSQIDSLIDIANQTPNFNFFPTSAGGTEFSYYSIRGLNNQNFLTAQDSVAFYIDDVPFDYNGFLDLALADLERVEVLRGSQSTLYGRNSSAGVVNIISREATPDPEVKFALGYGKYNSRELQFSLNDALVKDKLALRISGFHKSQDGFIENLATGNIIGERSRTAARAQLLWTPSDQWKVSFNSYNAFTDDGNPTYNRGDAPDPFKVNLQVEGFNKLSTNTQSLKIGYNGDAFRATSITARRFTTQENVVPGDTGVQYIDGINSTLWTQELRLQSPETADRFQWLLGAYYESRDFIVDDARTEFFGFGTFRRTGDDTRQTYAVFGQVDYKPIAPLTVFAGLRYESSTAYSDSTYESVAVNGSLNPLRPAFKDEKASSDEFIPRFGLKYQFNPNLMAYATIAKGYRPSGLNYRANSESTLRFGEEKTWSYEVGLKSAWLDNRLLANLSFFHNDVNNYQVLQFDESGFFGRVSNADLQATGVEFELNAKPTKGLDLIASIGYVDSRYKNYLNTDTGVDLSDNRVPLAPQFTYNLATQYRTPGGIFARAELRGYGLTYFDDDNQIKQDPYAVVNARIGYEWEKTGVYLYANNLFDTRYITSGFLFPPPVGTVGFGDPFTFGIQLRTSL